MFAPSPKSPTAVKEVNLKEGEAELGCNFHLSRGRSISVQAVDPKGKPLTGVEVDGIHEVRGSWFRPVETNPFELLAFRDNEVRTVLIRQQDRNLGRGLHIKTSDGDHQPLVVKLEPCATIQGRLVDGNGAPVRGVAVRFDIAHDRDYGRDLERIATDADGRFTRNDVPAGLPYSILAEGAGVRYVSIIKELAVEPGETIDLGTIDITTDKRPEPKRKKPPTQGGQPQPKTYPNDLARFQEVVCHCLPTRQEHLNSIETCSQRAGKQCPVGYISANHALG